MYDSSRYKAKLCLGEKVFPDPYKIDEAYWISDSFEKLPLVLFPDIFAYLVSTSGTFTSDNLKAFKSLDAWNVFLSSHVGPLKLCSVDTSGVFVKAEVQASQTASKSYNAWVLCHPNGSVMSAHCQCMAGLGEVCSHVAGVLYKIQAAVLHGLTENAPTSKACQWNHQTATKKVEPSKVLDIAADMGIPAKRSSVEFIMSDAAFQTELQDLPAGCALQSSLPVSGDVVDGRTELPYPIYKMFSILKKIAPSDAEPSRKYCEMLVNKLKKMYPSDVIGNVERATVDQGGSKEWLNQRHGRVTASVFGEVVSHVEGGRQSASLVRKIVEPAFCKLTVPAVVWGHTHEADACVAVEGVLSSMHSELTIRKCGLFVSPDHPYLAASPDGIIECACCGTWVLEVKCPFSLKDKSPQEAGFLDENGHLKAEHPYMMQVQGQMMVCGLKSCAFCVYVPGQKPHVLVIKYMESMGDYLVKVLETFYVKEIVPALLK
ncbi:uncharacterized protein LOC122372108 [Amphibalanus amphitrite]|uniref:uncharacterized protein LOC122372108 n=1 Tax=Amphibalanus amphitrite TaxID=1232801 RepID=UPI001C915E45|nr:uncharacterized protein LOC122372108 [Amphibalanus amphitrite]